METCLELAFSFNSLHQSVFKFVEVYRLYQVNCLWSCMMLLYFQIVSVIEMLVSYCNGTSLHNYCQNQSRYLINHSILCYFHTITMSQIYYLLSFFRRSNWIGLTFRGDLKLLAHFVSDLFLQKLVFLIFYKISSYIISSSKNI